jgi:probable rRNA maturation factor
MTSLHEEFMGEPGPTDVLSFPIDDDLSPPGRTPDRGSSGPHDEIQNEVLRLLGDIVICPVVAQKNAAEHGVGIDDEIALLVVHGMLHLFGMDHQTEKEASVMEALEQVLLKKFYVTDGEAS